MHECIVHFIALWCSLYIWAFTFFVYFLGGCDCHCPTHTLGAWCYSASSWLFALHYYVKLVLVFVILDLGFQSFVIVWPILSTCCTQLLCNTFLCKANLGWQVVCHTLPWDFNQLWLFDPLWLLLATQLWVLVPFSFAMLLGFCNLLGWRCLSHLAHWISSMLFGWLTIFFGCIIIHCFLVDILFVTPCTLDFTPCFLGDYSPTHWISSMLLGCLTKLLDLIIFYDNWPTLCALHYCHMASCTLLSILSCLP